MSNSPTPSEQQRPGRFLAVIARTTTRDKGYIFARGTSEDAEYFLHLSAVPADLWTELQPGDAITCKVSETSKGLRGWDVARATAAEQLALVAEQEDSRGNR